MSQIRRTAAGTTGGLGTAPLAAPLAIPLPPARAAARAAARVTAAFADAGVTGQLHALDIDTGASVSVGGSQPVPTSSIHKVCLLAALYREDAAGRLDRTRQIEIPGEARTPGLSGIALMRDDVRLSLRDLATLVVAVSDNSAADVLWQAVGMDTVNRTMADLGFSETVAVHLMADIGALLAAERKALVADGTLGEIGALASLSVLDPARTNRSTPRELTALLAAVWRDEVCAGDLGAELRSLLGGQAWNHRLASGFPFDDVRISGKTATLPTMRAEAGVVEYPDGGRYAVAVFTRAASPAVILPSADAVIGSAARIAVDALRAL